MSKHPRIRTQTIFVVLVLALFSSACSLAPLSPRDAASSVGQGVVKIDTNYLPATALNTSYGLSDNLDVGVDIENVTLLTTWTRYSFLNNRETGVSLAATGGVFTSNNRHHSNGTYIGALASYRNNKRVEWTAGYRYNRVSYEPDNYDNDYGWLTVNHVHNREDLSATGQLSASAAIRLKPHLQLTVGAICQYHYNNRSPRIDSDVCFPLLGLSFFSN
ncbi:MAG: hypothetical protein V3U76_17835 [Granulosicoccus sp.]